MSSSSPHYKGELIPDQVFSQENGKITLEPQTLSVIWGTDSRYWRIPDKSKKGPIELLQVCWLEVTGSVELSKLDKGKEYKVSFKLSMKPDAFGWKDSPLYLMAKPGKNGKYNWRSVDLSSRKSDEQFYVPDGRELRFTVPTAVVESDDKLIFGMYEIWKGRWKGGLLIHEVLIERCT